MWLEAEIGTVGSGPTPSWDKADIDVIDAGGQPASVIKGGSVYDHEMSFAFIRGDVYKRQEYQADHVCLKSCKRLKKSIIPAGGEL